MDRDELDKKEQRLVIACVAMHALLTGWASNRVEPINGATLVKESFYMADAMIAKAME
jgi:hypothetical protein